MYSSIHNSKHQLLTLTSAQNVRHTFIATIIHRYDENKAARHPVTYDIQTIDTVRRAARRFSLAFTRFPSFACCVHERVHSLFESLNLSQRNKIFRGDEFILGNSL